MELSGLHVSIIGVAAFLSGIATIYGFVRAMFKRRWDQHVRLTLLEHGGDEKVDLKKLKADLLNG